MNLRKRSLNAAKEFINSKRAIDKRALYPNPTCKDVTLKIESAPLDNLFYQVFDTQGKLLLSNRIDANTTDIDIGRFAVSKYVLKVTDVKQKKELKSFVIIKLY